MKQPEPRSAPPRLSLRRVLREANNYAIAGTFGATARAARALPLLRPERHRVEVLRDLRYRGSGDKAHLVDVYRPAERAGSLPAVLYVHGGGFRFQSKDTHHVFGLWFARRGYVVFNINYRLAPRHPFPAALEDACAAYAWVAAHAADYGADPSRLVLAGESAGANLICALTIAACYRRPEPFTRPVRQCGVLPRAVLPACGMLQVSDPLRFAHRRRLPLPVRSRLRAVSSNYLDGACADRSLELADPLCVLEQAEPPERPLPPFFAPVGTADVLLDDTRRLERALARLGVECEARFYPGGVHAFHAFVFRDNARRCWRDQFAFLDHHLKGEDRRQALQM